MSPDIYKLHEQWNQMKAAVVNEARLVVSNPTPENLRSLAVLLAAETAHRQTFAEALNRQEGS